jgi:hypothetical protein
MPDILSLFVRIDLRRCRIFVPIVSSAMLHKDQGRSSRKMIWVEGRTFWGWGCSECEWNFSPAEVPAGKSLHEMRRSANLRLSEEFEAHVCTAHSRAKAAKRSSQ